MRAATGIAILALLAALAALAAPRGLADLEAFGPRQALWREDARFPAPSEERWQQGRAQLQAALARDPGNPAHAEHLATWHERAARQLPKADREARAFLEIAVAQLRRAAVLRPGSPYTWSNLALVKLHLGEVDAELQRAVANAARLGPWEPAVQLALAEVLFAAAERLPAQVRSSAAVVAGNGLKYQDARLFARASALGRLGLLCALPGAGRSRLAVRCI